LIRPPRDWGLLDIFSTAPHPNATRGRLSVNQTNLAAWSAVLSGVVLSRATNDPDAGMVIPVAEAAAPAAVLDPMAQIVAGINRTRTNFAYGQFKAAGRFALRSGADYRSPFLFVPGFDPELPDGNAQIVDADYERIPQQVLSLLKVGEPRFVVYAWGQSLKPARRNPENTGPSIVTAGADKAALPQLSNHRRDGDPDGGTGRV